MRKIAQKITRRAKSLLVLLKNEVKKFAGKVA